MRDTATMNFVSIQIAFLTAMFQTSGLPCAQAGVRASFLKTLNRRQPYLQVDIHGKLGNAACPNRLDLKTGNLLQ